MSVDQSASISKVELSVFQEPEVSVKFPEILSKKEQETTAQSISIPYVIQYHDISYLEFDKTSKKVILSDALRDKNNQIGLEII